MSCEEKLENFFVFEDIYEDNKESLDELIKLLSYNLGIIKSDVDIYVSYKDNSKDKDYNYEVIGFFTLEKIEFEKIYILPKSLCIFSSKYIKNLSCKSYKIIKIYKIKDMLETKSVITLTFGDQAENHVGMEKLGSLVDIGHGFNFDDFQNIKIKLKNIGIDVIFFNLKELSEISDIYELKEDAHVIILKDGVNKILCNEGFDINLFNKERMFEEQSELNVDKKAFMYGRVVNKNARWNLCFDEKSREPDYENGKGRIISFNDVPITNSLRKVFDKYFGEKAKELKGEGNYYFDIKKCGIGFHGDSERRKVIAIRLGASPSLDLHYQWFKDNLPVGKRIVLPIDSGDIYIMSEKAVGTDWKKKKIYTLRHATGCDKFI
jgi:hypothetical protein